MSPIPLPSARVAPFGGPPVTPKHVCCSVVFEAIPWPLARGVLLRACNGSSLQRHRPVWFVEGGKEVNEASADFVLLRCCGQGTLCSLAC